MTVRVPQRAYPHRGKSPHAGPFVAHFPLDLFSLGSELSSNRDDEVLNDLLLKHYNSLSPSSEEQQSLSSLVTRVSDIFDALIVHPSDFTAGQLEQSRSVGSFKTGTWLSGQAVADVVVVLRTSPTLQAIESLMEIVRQRLTNHTTAEINLKPYGFCVSSGSALIQVLITSIPANLKKSDVHIDVGTQKSALAAIRQTRWLEENASHVVVKVLVMLIKDFRRRVSGFRHLSDWMIHLLAHHAVLINPMHQPLPVNLAFRRLMQLLSAGLLLPGSAGIIDPCEMGIIRPHAFLSLAAQDELCCAAQTLLRILLHGNAPLLFTYNEVDSPSADVRDQLLREASRAAGADVMLIWSEPVIDAEEGSRAEGQPKSSTGTAAAAPAALPMDGVDAGK